MLRIADKIRERAVAKYIEPARRRSDVEVKITAGELHKDLGLVNSVPNVCQALKSKEFQRANRIRLQSISGPPSGQSTTVVFTYTLESGEANQPREPHPLWKLRGAGKEMYRELGGGEKFIRAERNELRGLREQ